MGPYWTGFLIRLETIKADLAGANDRQKRKVFVKWFRQYQSFFTSYTNNFFTVACMVSFLFGQETYMKIERRFTSFNFHGLLIIQIFFFLTRSTFSICWRRFKHFRRNQKSFDESNSVNDTLNMVSRKLSRKTMADLDLCKLRHAQFYDRRQM